MRITVGQKDFIRQVDIKLPEGKQRIGVMLSGGADSAVLLYLLCLERKMDRSTQELIPFTVARPDGAWDYVLPARSYR
jgi:tRNA(Ile)-lysidine synthase TilS/MesJ